MPPFSQVIPDSRACTGPCRWPRGQRQHKTEGSSSCLAPEEAVAVAGQQSVLEDVVVAVVVAAEQRVHQELVVVNTAVAAQAAGQERVHQELVVVNSTVAAQAAGQQGVLEDVVVAGCRRRCCRSSP